MAVVIIIAATTGTILPFYRTLLFATSPHAGYVTQPSPNARPLDGFTLIERFERDSGLKVYYTPLDVPTDTAVDIFVSAREGQPALPYDVVWLDPYTAKVRLTYEWGGLSDGPQNIMPFIYSLHRGMVAGAWGVWTFGIACLIWTLDCFVGFYLTLPLRRKGVTARGRPARSWWSKWAPAWTIRKEAKGHKLNFDLHRASGLWMWPMLFVFAWSGVGFNLDSVANPVMQMFGADKGFDPEPLPQPLVHPRLTPREAAYQAERQFRMRARSHRFSFEKLEGLLYNQQTGIYRISARTSLDVSDEGGDTTMWINGQNGEVERFEPPLGPTKADTFMSWLYMLHMAQVFGLPYRIFVSILGIGIAALSVTGVLIWMKKRSAKILSANRKIQM